MSTFIPPLLGSALSGLTFGTAILFSNLIRQLFLLTTTSSISDSVFVPHDQTLNLPLFYIILLYLTSSACSALVVYLANTRRWSGRGGGVNLIRPRVPSEYGWFRYDGNVVGGLLQGVGMMATVSEPGSVFVRLGLGGRVGRGSVCLVCGGLVGGLVFVLGNGSWKRRTTGVVRGAATTGVGAAVATRASTLNEALDLTVQEGVAVYVLTVACVVTLVSLFLKDVGMPVDVYVEPVVGGLLIGVAQAVSIALTGGTVGVSSVYPNVATHLLRSWGRPLPNPGYGSIVFTLGMVVVGVYVATLGPDRGRRGEVIHRDARTDVIGGIAIILGARIAGGCTSGHGVSGGGTLSTSSFVTILSMVVGAMLWKLFDP